MTAPDGKRRETDCLSTENLLRVIQLNFLKQVVIITSMTKTNKKQIKKEVFFIATKYATRYKDKPANVQFYTKTGEQVSREDVKKHTSPEQGTRFYYSPAN